ncbi:DUF6782 family putative metallopeptidase [Micavibrio aeruginosavorus]|uniref:DUF6782 family putative metallopeptidase n=1 Tax=Micavibrio aeruginosavorus TaxID=349221 RepID=UPI003F4A8F6A
MKSQKKQELKPLKGAFPRGPYTTQSMLNRAFFGAAGFVLGCFLFRGMVGDVVPPPVTGGPLSEPFDLSCITVGQAERAYSLDPKILTLQALEKRARATEMGRRVLGGAVGDGVRACFNPELLIPSEEGSRLLGAFEPYFNRIDFAPDRDDETLTSTMVHEARHKQQFLIDLNYMKVGNVPEAERMIAAWLMEADARLVAIIAAREAWAAGDQAPMDRLLSDSAYQPMIVAMISTEVQFPGDHVAVMAAAIKAYRQSRELTNLYDPRFMRVIGAMPPYNPAKARDVLLSDKVLMAVGDMGTYGNYMTSDLKKFIRDSFTDQDWRDMKAAQDCLQKRKLGQTKNGAKELCPSWPRPSA